MLISCRIHPFFKLECSLLRNVFAFPVILSLCNCFLLLLLLFDFEVQGSCLEEPWVITKLIQDMQERSPLS